MGAFWIYQGTVCLSSSHGYFGFMDLEEPTGTNDFAFTALTLTGHAVPQYTRNGAPAILSNH